jgi:hypothetical protein
MSHTLCCGQPSRRSVLPAVNLKITTALGLTILPSALTLADE